MIDYAEANFSAEQSPSREDARVQSPDVDEGRPPCVEEASGQGAQAPDAGALLTGNRLPKGARLKSSAEFRPVYERGRRYDGPLMTIFLLPNSLGLHRLGITASRKMSLDAVKRNRAKRLLREAFRLSGGELSCLKHTYDWVINARRALLEVKVSEPLRDFREVIARVGRNESDAPRG